MTMSGLRISVIFISSSKSSEKVKNQN